MTYLSDEQAGLTPVELFQFTYGTQTWNFTDADSSYVHPVTGATYQPEPLWRQQFKQSNEDDSMNVDVIVDVQCPIADFFRTPYLPTEQVWLLIERAHRGSATTPAVLFRGKVGQCAFDGEKATLSCVPTRHALRKKVPVQLVQKLCTNTLYDQRCKAVPANFSLAMTVTAINGLTITVSNAARTGAQNATGYFDGGFVADNAATAFGPATIIDDQITGSGTGTLKLLYNPGISVGDSITAYAGCDKRMTTCAAKFANTIHFQGFPRMPLLDPFTNEAV